MMTDPIADMLTRIRNGLAAGKLAVQMPGSKVKAAIAEVLRQEGYIKGFKSGEADGKPILEVELKYYEGRPVISELKRESRPSLRVYRKADGFPTIIGGLGVAIVSTSKGIMTASAAREAGVGGEVLCSVS